MKKISLVLTFLSIMFFKAIAQQVPKNDGTKTEIKNINDDDGDGIVNTEDACPPVFATGTPKPRIRIF